ncbi:phage portal protein [Priestia sp. SIMBA_032]|uniref:phage portal protein n=1 Tax=Priestia sp. SIMBA_032 TaxID=3085775 RepID=UPI0039797AC6
MGLFGWMFGNKQPDTKTLQRFEMISDQSNGFFAWGGDLYASDIVRSCIRPKARAIGKLIAKHIRDSVTDFKENPNVTIRFLLEEPNPLMTGQMLQEKMATQLELNHNAFAYMKRDPYTNVPYEIYHLNCVSVEALEGREGDLFLKFYFANGKSKTIPYTDVIHLRKDFHSSDLFGESPANTLAPLMEIVNTTDQGIVQAIKNSAVIKWILKFTANIRPEDMKKQVDEFTNSYLNIENTGGAAGVDSKFDAIQVKADNFVPNAEQMDRTIQRIYSFFNINEKIIQSKYNEDEWNAFYESEIEPIARQLSEEFTRKIFSRTERGYGNKIIFEASSLQYASMQTKLALVQLVDRRAMVPNEWRRVLNLAPIEGGDLPLRRLDTIVDGGNTTTDESSKGGENVDKGDEPKQTDEQSTEGKAVGEQTD